MLEKIVIGLICIETPMHSCLISGCNMYSRVYYQKARFQQPIPTLVFACSYKMPYGDNTVDRFLNQVGRLIYTKDMYDRLGLELDFKKYELEGKYTNSQGKSNIKKKGWNSVNPSLNLSIAVGLYQNLQSISLNETLQEVSASQLLTGGKPVM